MSEADEGVEFFAGGAGVDRIGGETDAVAEISGAAGGDESSGGVRENDVTLSGVFAVEKRAAENFMNDFGVVFCVAASVGVRGRAVEAEIFGRKFV